MIVTIVRRARAVVLIAAAACVTGRVGSTGAAAGHDWNDVLTQAEAAARDHRYAEADRLLADFAARYPGSEGATESLYWRGVISLEPENHDASPQIAAALLETYNRSGSALPHRLEADILRHLALRVQALSGGAVATAAAPSSAANPSASPDRSADLKAKDTEIQRLKDELAKANDELERIKRRLTTPTKP